MILFAHSFFLAQDAKQREKMKPYAPLSTLLAAALVRRAGREVVLFDATFEAGPQAFIVALERLRPSGVVLMEDNFNFLTKMCTAVRRESALAMVRAARARGCRVAVNGPDAADHPELYLEAGAQVVVLGEGEEAVAETVACWERGEDPDAVAGLVLLGEDGRTQRTAPRRAMQNLDRLPPPAWDLVDVAAYRTAWTRAHGRFSWNIATSRGCPYACNWCAKPTFGRRYTVRSPGDVVREMARLKAEIAPDHLWFTDDILGLDVDWICDFADGVVAAGAAIPFSMQSRVNLMTERAVAALAAAGAREVWLGVETGSQKILDAMDKAATIEAARTATRVLKAHGVKACWFIQLGYPGETWEDLLATRDLIRQEGPQEVGVSVAYPLPGTTFHDRVAAQLGGQRNWKDTGDLAMLFQGTYDSAFYRKVRDVLHREVDTGRWDDAAWTVLEAQAVLHRSPAPSTLAVEA
ncbi:radical SAM protein [Caulobacter sp. BK020]|uniref:B12-binding domain-containing radical SAM protein n=1 Tax=Caulobacter sp. BK020 TaxID=2512117 RepID=UPI0010493D79|nr:radical SAM protein [Caulobacter sp. BK020]TCS14925.1 anaerobic magnesium-protoporphyrin IX monomethyl ester cyclase [Caulobacter sp. BK020]